MLEHHHTLYVKISKTYVPKKVVQGVPFVMSWDVQYHTHVPKRMTLISIIKWGMDEIRVAKTFTPIHLKGTVLFSVLIAGIDKKTVFKISVGYSDHHHHEHEHEHDEDEHEEHGHHEHDGEEGQYHDHHNILEISETP